MRIKGSIALPIAISELTQPDKEFLEGFQFFLMVAGNPEQPDHSNRYLASAWYNGLLTTEEGKRILAEVR